MANPNHTRFTLMAFPQHFDGTGVLTVNIVFIPRNISPLEKVQVPYATTGSLTPFADVKPEFEVVVVQDPNEFPGKIPANEVPLIPSSLTWPDNTRKLYETLKNAQTPDARPKYFDIDENRSADKPTAQRAPKPVDKESALRKYLPVSYRTAFNFTSPRLPNAKTDDSYRCALRDQTKPPALVKDDKVSWGKVYAYLLRQPLMAEKAGLIYKTSVTINPQDYKNGGWLYVRIKDGTAYSQEQKDSLTAGELFIKRYAARIPALKNGEPRSLFAAVLFPVLNAGENVVGNFDDLYVEAARFDDGFATITHANQPVSQHILQEEQDGFHPQKEMGVRLGWEDEQILIWYLRQLAKDETVTGNERLDAPLGVVGFHVDVQDADNTGAGWESLTAVRSNGDMLLEDINIGGFSGELPFQVYPTKLYSLTGDDYWLPMYFANWNDHSLVIPDKTAALLYQNDKDNTLEKRVTISDTYTPVSNTIRLRYGKQYNFRVRMADISGGGPAPAAPDPLSVTPSGIAGISFKRYIAPNTLRITGDTTINHSTDDENFSGNRLTFQRPLLGYPAVVYTGQYPDPIADLQAASNAMVGKGAFGIADPDVAQVEIKVEVETLKMDNLLSDTGRENYITLFKTYRDFDVANFDAAINVGIQYKDMPVLQLGNTTQPYVQAADNDFITATAGDIILPTARNLRITLRAVCQANNTYWGHNSPNPDLNSRYGKTTQLRVRRASSNEQGLFNNLADPQLLQGIYLQPDPPKQYTNKLTVTKYNADKMPDIVQRLAKQLDVECNGLTLLAKKGQRLQFGCSNLIRHTMAPDNSSITFANNNELQHRWLLCTYLNIGRDWTWDGLDDLSFLVQRKRKFDFETKAWNAITAEDVGDIELRRTAPFQAIQEGDDGTIHREETKLIFIDAVDPKPFGGHLPDTLAVQYTIRPQLRKKEDNTLPLQDDDFTTPILNLPTTVNPHSIPQLIGAGIALSPYVRNKNYSATEPRRRYLWLEFEKLPDDSRDALFARVLAYAPDQLLSNNHPSLYEISEEPPLPVDPEYIRVFTPDSAQHHAGLNAMQKMEKSTDTDRHFYLLPLPPGLHGESAELFGFFTYEFRFGHSDQLWSTAQGRFGRALRVTGLQHPAPNLFCTVNRDEKKVSVNAPYAMTVFDGKNVTSNPPRTSLWCLLYAQVKQADGSDYRNVLLDEKRLQQPSLSTLREKTVREFKEKGITSTLELATALHMHQALHIDAVRYGETQWANGEISEILELYGLPEDSSLSVLCVETFGHITNIKEHINNFDQAQQKIVQGLTLEYGKEHEQKITSMVRRGMGAQPKENGDRPLSNELGKYRILRTSPLVEVPFVCCTEC
ncbi:hypothetical protein HRH25_09595 [Flavisolibacter sp. BT320]|nr:hypothetical protein [Flavisolibacter longurius]